jgi:hypothetical protein
MFELGATWSRAKQVIPLLGGDLKDADIPGSLRGSAGGRLQDSSTFDQLLPGLTDPGLADQAQDGSPCAPPPARVQVKRGLPERARIQ